MGIVEIFTTYNQTIFQRKSKHPPLASPLGEVAERSEVGEGLVCSTYSPKVFCYRIACRDPLSLGLRRASSPSGGSRGRFRAGASPNAFSITKKDTFDIFVYFHIIEPLLNHWLDHLPAFPCVGKLGGKFIRLFRVPTF